jgi:hypothetical protein
MDGVYLPFRYFEAWAKKPDMALHNGQSRAWELGM